MLARLFKQFRLYPKLVFLQICYVCQSIKQSCHVQVLNKYKIWIIVISITYKYCYNILITWHSTQCFCYSQFVYTFLRNVVLVNNSNRLLYSEIALFTYRHIKYKLQNCVTSDYTIERLWSFNDYICLNTISGSLLWTILFDLTLLVYNKRN